MSTIKISRRAVIYVFVALTVTSVESFNSYLDSLSKSSQESIAPKATSTSDYLNSLTSQEDLSMSLKEYDEPPDEWYGKTNPVASWEGYKDSRWGGYLNNLGSQKFEAGKKSDYGDDVRWGAEVYLNNLVAPEGNQSPK